MQCHLLVRDLSSLVFFHLLPPPRIERDQLLLGWRLPNLMISVCEEKLAIQYIDSTSMFSHLVFSCTCNVGSQKVLKKRR